MPQSGSTAGTWVPPTSSTVPATGGINVGQPIPQGFTVPPPYTAPQQQQQQQPQPQLYVPPQGTAFGTLSGPQGVQGGLGTSYGASAAPAPNGPTAHNLGPASNAPLNKQNQSVEDDAGFQKGQTVLDTLISTIEGFAKGQLGRIRLEQQVRVAKRWRDHLRRLAEDLWSPVDQISLDTVLEGLEDMVIHAEGMIDRDLDPNDSEEEQPSEPEGIPESEPVQQGFEEGLKSDMAKYMENRGLDTPYVMRASAPADRGRPRALPMGDGPVFDIPISMENLQQPEPLSQSEYLYSQWYAVQCLSNLPSFDGTLEDYLPWKSRVFPLLCADRRGPVATFNTLISLLRGRALERVKRVDAISERPFLRVFEILEKHYNQPGDRPRAYLARFNKMAVPNADDPDQLESFAWAVDDVCKVYDRTGEPLENNREFYEKVLNKLPHTIQRKWGFKNPNSKVDVAGLLRLILETEQALRTTSMWRRKAIAVPETKEKNAKTVRIMATQVGGSTDVDSDGSSELETIVTPGARRTEKLTTQPSPKRKVSENPPRRKGEQVLNTEDRKLPIPGQCPHCHAKDHSLTKCPAFETLDPNKRLQLAFTWYLHFPCLKHHDRGACALTSEQQKCKFEGCKQYHHRLLHGATIRRYPRRTPFRPRGKESQKGGGNRWT